MRQEAEPLTHDEQSIDCALMLLIIVVMSPVVFWAADWMRYGA